MWWGILDLTIVSYSPLNVNHKILISNYLCCEDILSELELDFWVT